MDVVEKARRSRRTSSGQTPIYAEIESVLRANIRDGVFKIGDRLPTEHELCAQFDASRFTVRQALAGLRESGLIDARPGIGTIVVASTRRKTFVQTINSVEELLQYPLETYRTHLNTSEIRASSQEAMMLKCKVGQPWTKLNALRMTRSQNAPISWLDAYVTPEFDAVIEQANPSGSPLVRQIEDRFGHAPARAQVEIFVSRITAELANTLMAEEDDPALVILRRYRGTDGIVYLVTYSVHPENRFSLNFEFENH